MRVFTWTLSPLGLQLSITGVLEADSQSLIHPTKGENMFRITKIREYMRLARKEGSDTRITFGKPAILQLKAKLPKGEIVGQGAIFGVRLCLSPEFYGERTARTFFLARSELSTRGVEFYRFWEPWEIATDYTKVGPFDFRQIAGPQIYECWNLTTLINNYKKIHDAFPLAPVFIDHEQSLLEAVPSVQTRLAKLGIFAKNNLIPFATYEKHLSQLAGICIGYAGREAIITVGLKTAVADLLNIFSIEEFERKHGETSIPKLTP